MARYHDWLNGHEFEQTPRDSGGQRSLACCSWGVAKSMTWFSNWITITTVNKKKKKEWNTVIGSNMGGLTDYHIKWSKSDRQKRSIIWYHSYVESNLKKKKKWTYLQNKIRFTGQKQTYGYQRGSNRVEK